MRKEALLILANKGKVDAVTEVISRVPAIFQLGFHSDRIPQSFAITGSISKSTKSNKYSSYPDLHKMMGQCKIQLAVEETKQMESQAASFIKFMLNNGHHTKTFVDGDDANYPNIQVSPYTDIDGVVNT